ncbi:MULTISPECIES: TadE/TadG family type IV pilus assembly protein [Paenibacillus]|uniref:TadE/TadG family type IV pilus assembly protein n=1 Tax=Paenibacillus TaxID=44249 RepID=UPI0022B8CE47|nr:TadE family protein [Paenibacillus caseinilyticus]MCZ8521515.1 pilus assembly protein [Paenibacillus caseinilyticus]
MKSWKRLVRGDKGSMVLEAALTLPFFLAFVMLLVGFIRISLAEMALQSTVSEAAKVMAANMYPMRQMYLQGQAQWQNSPTSAWLDNVVTQANTATQTVTDTEAFVENYAQWIPAPLVQLVAWEKSKREQVQSWGTDKAGEAKEAAQRRIAEGASPIIASFADEGRLDKERIKVTALQFPNLENLEEAYITIEAEYPYTFQVPFFKKTVILKKKATERAWVGGGV